MVGWESYYCYLVNVDYLHYLVDCSKKYILYQLGSFLIVHSRSSRNTFSYLLLPKSSFQMFTTTPFNYFIDKCRGKVLIFLNYTSWQSYNVILNFEPLSFFVKSKYICLRYCHVIYLSLGCSSECILVCNSSPFNFRLEWGWIRLALERRIWYLILNDVIIVLIAYK